VQQDQIHRLEVLMPPVHPMFQQIKILSLFASPGQILTMQLSIVVLYHVWKQTYMFALSLIVVE
jgi:hypothetical protein